MIIDILQSYAKENGADGTKRIILLLKFFLRSLLNDNSSSTWTSEGYEQIISELRKKYSFIQIKLNYLTITFFVRIVKLFLNRESSTAWRCKMIRQISNFIQHWQGDPFTNFDIVDKTKDNNPFDKSDGGASESTELFHKPRNMLAGKTTKR